MIYFADIVSNKDDQTLIGAQSSFGSEAGANESVRILLMLSGKGEMYFGNEYYSMSEGCIFVIPVGREVQIKPGPKYKALIIVGSFGLLAHLDGVKMLVDNEHGEGRKLAELILLNKNGNEGYLGILSEAYVRYILMNVDRTSRNTSAAISKIILRMEKEFGSSDLSIGRLLDESGYTRDYIRSEFESVTGMTPKKYLNIVRMNKAKALIELCADEMTISEVAERCGVIDPTIFSRVFKKHFGISPSQYKLSLQKGNNQNS